MESLITILIPTRNEEKYIRSCLESVLAFDLPAGVAMEVLVLDGRSTDRTVAIVEEVGRRDPRIAWCENPGIIQSCALNTGVRRAQGVWVMRIDAHTRYPRDYLKLCHETAVRTGAANVGGLCVTECGGTGYQAQLVQAMTTHKFGVGDSGFRTGAREGPRDTVPFGFFPHSLFEAVGFFDERLVRAQDYEFNRRIVASGRTVWLNPAIVCHYYNQPTLRAFFRKQFVHEAPYNAYMWHLAPYAFAVRHAITAVFALGVLGGLVLAPLSPWIAWPFAGVMLLYALLAAGSAAQQARRYGRIAHLVCLPPLFFAYHFLHGVGVWVGLLRLVAGMSPVQQTEQPWPGAGRRRAWPPTRAA